MDEVADPHSGTMIRKLSEENIERMEEYDREVEELAEKLVEKVDIKKMIHEQLKARNHPEIKTGLYILKKEEEGEEVEVAHNKGCYNFSISYKDLIFMFESGYNIQDGVDVTGRRN